MFLQVYSLYYLTVCQDLRMYAEVLDYSVIHL